MVSGHFLSSTMAEQGKLQAIPALDPGDDLYHQTGREKKNAGGKERGKDSCLEKQWKESSDCGEEGGDYKTDRKLAS